MACDNREGCRSPLTLIVGDPCYEIVARVDRYPAAGEEAEVSKLIECGGGSGTNTAVFLAQIGGHVGLIGCVGEDEQGEYLWSELARAGVVMHGVHRVPGIRTALAFLVTTDNGEWTCFVHRGAYAKLSPEHIDESYLGTATWLHIPGFAALSQNQQAAVRKAIDIAAERGIPVSLDPGWPLVMRYRPWCLHLFERMQMVFPNRYEAAQLTGASTVDEAASRILEMGPSVAVIKDGARGFLVASSEARYWIPAIKVSVADTLGAGDGIAAGFLYGVQKGWPLRRSAYFAAALAARVCMHAGSRSEPIRYDDIEDLMRLGAEHHPDTS